MSLPPADDLCYLVPAANAEAELVIKNSVFIGSVGRARSPEEAASFVDRIRQAYPDAHHHAWAYCLTGGPQAQLAFSDDGEPGGTAGRPMLAVLQGRGVREVVAVGTRYFGGIKLGAGGLVRAYGGCIRAALEMLPLANRVYHLLARITIPYPLYGNLTYLLPRYDVTIQEERFGEAVELLLSIPHGQQEPVAALLRELTNGHLRLAEHWQGGHYVELAL